MRVWSLICALAGPSLVLVAAATTAAGCRGDREVDPGHERGDCRPDRSCDVGLVCLSNLCVRPPPADCQDVGDQLASIELGNHAEPAIRAPVVARYKAACNGASTTREEQLCLDRARDRWSAAQCAPRMFPDLEAGEGGDCAAIVARLRTAMQKQASYPDPQTKTWFERTVVVMQQSCEQDHWPEPLKKCMLAGDGLAALTQACSQQAPPALQQRLQERLNQAMQDVAR